MVLSLGQEAKADGRTPRAGRQQEVAWHVPGTRGKCPIPFPPSAISVQACPHASWKEAFFRRGIKIMRLISPS